LGHFAIFCLAIFKKSASFLLPKKPTIVCYLMLFVYKKARICFAKTMFLPCV
jgi:hypothetical protein